MNTFLALFRKVLTSRKFLRSLKVKILLAWPRHFIATHKLKIFILQSSLQFFGWALKFLTFDENYVEVGTVLGPFGYPLIEITFFSSSGGKTPIYLRCLFFPTQQEAPKSIVGWNFKAHLIIETTFSNKWIRNVMLI